MSSVWVIALNAFRQTVRQRLFYNVAIFGIGMLLLAMVVGKITFGYPDRVVRSIGLSGVSLSLDLIALLLGVALIHQEIDRKTLFVVLTRPLRRWQYTLGRFIGLLIALLVAELGLAIVFILTLVAADGEVRFQDIAALMAAFPEAAILGGIGLVLSAFSTPTLSAGVGIGAWIMCTTLDDFVRLAEKAKDPTTIAISKTVSYMLPNLSRFNFRDAAIYDLPLPTTELLAALFYGLIYVAALVALASGILSRREMI
jgi:ABC-type transport system involved in multi-copper enzyme maturation permease subunit